MNLLVLCCATARHLYFSDTAGSIYEPIMVCHLEVCSESFAFADVSDCADPKGCIVSGWVELRWVGGSHGKGLVSAWNDRIALV
ncbi:hypothetical protein PanWU01x14_323580 [Parasponia andersonii]|uniref:Uncharacterized protein n=1 Tax=Parasponia andersonii TaxID=3476 RepID=A0A2P5AKF2_PARAD|nr:hypothetical protein PanWU01x14_323580 [Parasponia andersonii]